MDKDRIIKGLDKGIGAIILGAVFLLPLYFNPFTSDSFNKVYLFFFAVEASVVLFAAKIAVSGEIRLREGRNFYIGMIVLAISQAIATAISDHPYASFWGSYFRHMGLFSWLHIYCFSFIFYNSLGKGGITAKNLGRTISISAFMVSAYSLVQMAGFDFLPWIPAGGDSMLRATSTIGQPNFLGFYLLLTLPISWFVFGRSKKFSAKIFFFLSFVSQFISLVLTYSRAAWLGALSAAMIFFIGYLWKKKKIMRMMVVLSVVFAVVIGFFIFSNSFSPKKDRSMLDRLEKSANLKEGSVGMRMLYYKAAWPIFKERPFFGHGLDTQSYYFYKYYNKDYPLFEIVNTYPDRSHNETVDIMITIGLFGLAAWIFFLASAIRVVLKTNDPIIGPLLFSILSLLIALNFGFFTTVDVVYFWIILTLAVFTALDPAERTIRLNVRKPILMLFFLSASACIAYIFWRANIRPQLADYYYLKSKIARHEKDYNNSIVYGNLSIDYQPKEIYFRNRFAIENLPLVLSIENEREKLSFLEYLKEALSEKGSTDYTMESRAFLGMIYSEIARVKSDLGGKVGDISEFKKAEDIFEELISDNPGRARLYLDYGNVFLYQKSYDQAIDSFKEALSLYPDFDDPRMNDEHRQHVGNEMVLVYKRIVEALSAENDYADALEYIKKAMAIRPFDLSLRDALNTAYDRTGETDELINSLKHLAISMPNDDRIYYFLAVNYKKEKNIREAKTNIEKAIKLKDKKEYFEFLRFLK